MTRLSCVQPRLNLLLANRLGLGACRVASRRPGDLSTGEAAAQMLGRFVRLTRPISYLGLPVVVANAGFTRAGMPIGMQLIAAPLDEATALRAGHAFQRATDWHVRAALE